MQKALEEDTYTGEEEIKELYAAWSKTYEKVNKNFLNSRLRPNSSSLI
jgi:hypothetical protein